MNHTRQAATEAARLRALDTAREHVQAALLAARSVQMLAGSRNTMDVALSRLVDAQRLLDAIKSDGPAIDSFSSLHTTPSGD